MMADINEMVKYHEYSISEILDLTPFDYKVIKLMIIEDMQKEIDSQQSKAQESHRGGY